MNKYSLITNSVNHEVRIATSFKSMQIDRTMYMVYAVLVTCLICFLRDIS